jgi:hypothetical protein
MLSAYHERDQAHVHILWVMMKSRKKDKVGEGQEKQSFPHLGQARGRG